MTWASLPHYTGTCGPLHPTTPGPAGLSAPLHRDLRASPPCYTGACLGPLHPATPEPVSGLSAPLHRNLPLTARGLSTLLHRNLPLTARGLSTLLHRDLPRVVWASPPHYTGTCLRPLRPTTPEPVGLSAPLHRNLPQASPPHYTGTCGPLRPTTPEPASHCTGPLRPATPGPASHCAGTACPCRATLFALLNLNEASWARPGDFSPVCVLGVFVSGTEPGLGPQSHVSVCCGGKWTFWHIGDVGILALSRVGGTQPSCGTVPSQTFMQ